MFITTWLRSQLLITPPDPVADFSDQTIIVTGASTGLGLEAARHFARLHCTRLILAVRDPAKGDAAKASILASTQREANCIEIWELDLSRNASVQAFAKRAQELNRLDAVVENAGVLTRTFQRAPDGGEQITQFNVVATLLLALLLLPKLRATAEMHGVGTHLEIVTSETHHLTTVKEADSPDLYATLNDAGQAQRFDARERYSVSKALELLFVRELVTHTGTSPTITLVNPGLCHSEFTRDISAPVEVALLKGFKGLFARRTDVGARTLVAGVTAGAESHGMYMSDSANQEVAGWVRGKRGVEVQRKVYEETMKVLEGIEPGIGGNL